MVIMDLLNYIKDFFSQGLVNRKRRLPDDFEPPHSPHSSKYRKLSTSKMSGHGDCINLLDDLVSNASSSSVRRSRNYSSSHDLKFKTPREVPTINLDDDDDVIVMSARESLNHRSYKAPGKFTSTPNFNSARSQVKDDDVTFLRVIEPSPENRLLANKRRSGDLSSTKPFTPLYSNGSTHNGATHRVSPNDVISPIFGSARSKKSTFRKTPHMPNTAYRLDEKKIYRQLLMSAAPSLNGTNLLDFSFNDFSTPIGKIFSSSTGSMTRGKKLVHLATRSVDRKKPIEFIDLTEPSTSGLQKKKLSAKETIKGVIDKFDNDVIQLNSDSSDIEVLPTPPSPKGDFQIRRINSLKTFVDPSEPCHENWIDNLLFKHKRTIEKREREIQEQKVQRQRFSEINNELRTRRLEDDIRRVLKIKETLLPVELPKETVPLPDLTDEQERLVHRVFDKYSDDNEVMARKFNMNITRRDLRTLSGSNWLNDEVINFYMNLLMERGKNQKYPKVYAMNTFFYPKLLKDGYQSIRRWTKKVDIFTHDMIVAPIHLRMHWCMAIVDLRQKTITYFDSMGSPNRLCLDTLLEYLEKEHLDKKMCNFDTADWELINAREIPQQMNGSDCGMFACTFAEFLCRNADITFSQEDMPYLRRKMVVEIIEGRLLIT